MLAQVSISQWTGRRYDKTVSQEVEKAHAARDAGRFNKMLVDKALLDPIAKLAGEIRQYHYDKTLPWSNDGARLLPSKLFMDYSTWLRNHRDKFNTLVRDLVSKYPDEVQAARQRLGTMYNPEDYPAPSEIGRKFAIEVEFVPVPDARDFRVEVTNEVAEEIRESITKAVEARQTQAIKDCYRRAYDVVSKIHERLSDPKAIFKDSLIENARDLADVLPSLNILDDPRLTVLQADIERLTKHAPRTLRNASWTRAEVAGIAGEILANTTWLHQTN